MQRSWWGLVAGGPVPNASPFSIAHTRARANPLAGDERQLNNVVRALRCVGELRGCRDDDA